MDIVMDMDGQLEQSFISMLGMPGIWPEWSITSDNVRQDNDTD